jgi:MarR family transcriptional regulator, lower aerobic nicotinate degradation pathway regulator
VTPATTQIVTGRLPGELLESNLFLLKRLGMLAKERSFAAYEAAGFTPYQHAALLVLDEGSRETQGEIADVLGYDRGQLVGILDELEERGLIERKRDPNDRRRHLVSMTPAGRKALARLRALAQSVDDEYLSPLSDDERETLHTLLMRLAEVHEPRCAPPISS